MPDDERGCGQTILKATVTLRTVIFVGFGSGLSDPNFGRLLEWMAAVFPTSEYRHYRLVLRSEVALAEQSQPKGSRIRCLAYGDSHAELVPFLRSLK